MSKPRFFISDNEIDSTLTAGSAFQISGENAHHASKVLRLQAGEHIVLCKGDGQDHYCEVLGSGTDGLRLRYLHAQANPGETSPQVVLWQGLPKGSKFEEIIEKSVELGVHRIVPVRTERSLIKLDDKAARAKQSRWQKVSESAAKQSGRGLIPEIGMTCTLASALVEIASDLARGNGLALIAWEEALEPNLVSFIVGVLESLSDIRVIHVLIGPEGGFAKSEVDAAVETGVTAVSLGSRILRTETAGPAVLAMLNALLPGRM